MADARRTSRVLLIGWDAADWKFINPLLDSGQMPNLARLVDHGAIANLASLKPCLSPILWTSIATGKTAEKHGIAGFVEPIPGGAGLRIASSTSRTCKAIWNILSQNDLTSIVVNWYASHPAEPIRGICVSNRYFEGYPPDRTATWDVIPGSVHPQNVSTELAEMRLHPAELAPPDLARLIPDISLIDFTRDRRPGQLADVLARTVSIHCVATHLMENKPWDFMAVYYDGLDVAGHLFMPYHPPKLPHIADDDFSMYQHVMQELYLFHDEMLGRLLDLAGEDTTVMLVSDHGFHCDHLRPAQCGESPEAQAAAWHRHYGILAMRGPGIIQDERIYGATLLDITPTVLNLFGLRTGRDMDGRPLLQAFEDRPQFVKSVPSWETVPGDDGSRHPVGVQQSMVESAAAIEQLIALGYLPAATAESSRAVEIAVAETKFNLAIVHSYHGRSRLALPILEDLCQSHPEQIRYSVALAKTHANLGDHHKSREIVEQIEAKGWRAAECELLAAAAHFNEGRVDLALQRLAQCESRYPPSAMLFGLMGKIHLERQSWEDAVDAFEKSLALDDDDAHAHNGVAMACLKLREFEKAAEHALRSIGLLFFNPSAHFHLGMAFKGMGENDRAIRSLKLAVTQSPRFMEAHQELENLKEEAALARRAAT
jgi:predicted AlkP superfamily phosphohydrolase/phosphomutase/tetratricopeptide (TPR) repeat protein